MLNDHQLEMLWDQILSREPEKIRAAFAGLDPASQQEVYTHLQRMTREAGWHPEQRRSAEAALSALEKPAP